MFIMLVFFCLQLITGLIKRDPTALSRAALGASISDPIAGVVLMAMAAFAPYLTYKFIAFVGFDMYHPIGSEQSLNRLSGDPQKVLDRAGGGGSGKSGGSSGGGGSGRDPERTPERRRRLGGLPGGDDRLRPPHPRLNLARRIARTRRPRRSTGARRREPE
ncbi:hypothetical protein GGQ54_002261 [Naumannella cuiyingiana]|uniref:Uncharacterized protein n=1 Tax=Naumannella cuiyingiana TaxID=1347891 RepID=A0A7Z0DAB9_9ACTN|nr:hypothetical protein [Naumannella cuiyingiana]NYI71701.1 hypothetical protein [Naumannella cuiyingiana]